MEEYYSHGKLLLSGEYMVLRGAKALAIPCKMGQSLKFTPQETALLKWQSWDHNGQLWFSADFSIPDFEILNTDTPVMANRLAQILKQIRLQKNTFLKEKGGSIATQLEFDRHWGLGSSSTLISNLSQWSKTNPYLLLENSFGGSGYDIACATAKKPLVYQMNNPLPEIEEVEFDPSFKSNLFFVYLNQKKNSSIAVQQFKNIEVSPEKVLQTSALTRQLIDAKKQSDFELYMMQHENLLGEILGLKTIKEIYFQDYQGAVKSLGAWGGDFVLASGDKNTPDYFKEKGFKVVIPYEEMVY